MQRHRRHVPRLAALIPPGWAVSEGIQLSLDDGFTVAATVTGAAPDADARTIADGHEPSLRKLGAFVSEEPSERVAFGGLAAIERKFSFEHEGSPYTGMAVYGSDQDVACVASATWPAEQTDREVAAARVIAGFRLASRSAGHVPEYWSIDELQLLALLAGAPSFPTIDPARLHSLPEETRAAVQDAVATSLLARGLLGEREGSVQPHEAITDAFLTARSPERTVAVERVDSTGHRQWWFGQRPGHALCVAAVSPWGRTLTELVPADLPAELEAVAALGSGVEGTVAGGNVSDDRLSETLGGVTARVAVRSAWRDGGVFVSRDSSWIQAGDGGIYRATRLATSADHWQFAGCGPDTVRAELLEHLGPR